MLRAQNPLLEKTLWGLRIAALVLGVGMVIGEGADVYAAQAPATAETAALTATTPTAAGPAAAPDATALSAAQATAEPAQTAEQTTTPNSVTGKGGKLKKVKKKKEKAPKLTPIHIKEATLTVDGWTGKARLNYDIADLKYIYVWAPSIGTLVISNTKFPMSVEQKNAFNLNNLTVEANGHEIQISSEERIMKSKKPVSAWVYLDTTYNRHSGYPEMGYGNGKDAPYAWPGAKQVGQEKGVLDAPPLPAGLRPTLATAGCVSTSGPQGASTRCVPPTTTASTSGSVPVAGSSLSKTAVDSSASTQTALPPSASSTAPGAQ